MPVPWRGAETPGEFPTLGYLVADFIEDSCAIPDGDQMGEPYLLTDEQLRFLLWHYRVDPKTGRFAFRRSQLVRPQKWGKGPLSAAMICAEAEGPVLFAGWDAAGEPVGKPWPTPWIQVTAVSEDQTDNIWRALQPMIELGSIAADIPDTGLTRINLPGGGYIEPVTASARSRLGQRITFAVQDETHSWLKTNGGVALADNQRRNLAGMNGRSIETTNAWNPADGSVAQATYESPAQDIHRDYPQPMPGSFTNKRERRRCLKHAYGDSWWVSIDRIDAEVEELLPRDPQQAERFFGNRIKASADHAIDIGLWRSRARPLNTVRKGELITLGFDGARFHDSTALIGCRVRDAFLFVLGIWERPDGADAWEVPEDQVHAAVLDAFDRFKVWRMNADPPHWQDQISTWHGMFGAAIESFWTNRDTQMAYAVKRLLDGLVTGEVTHDGNRILARHVANARRRMTRVRDDETGQLLAVLDKDRPQSSNKIDGATAATLALEARAQAVADGVLAKKEPARLVSF